MASTRGGVRRPARVGVGGIAGTEADFRFWVLPMRRSGAPTARTYWHRQNPKTENFPSVPAIPSNGLHVAVAALRPSSDAMSLGLLTFKKDSRPSLFLRRATNIIVWRFPYVIRNPADAPGKA